MMHSLQSRAALAQAEERRRRAAEFRRAAEAKSTAKQSAKYRSGIAGLVPWLLGRTLRAEEGEPAAEIHIRFAAPDDRLGLLNLALENGSSVVPGPLLVAEQRGRLRAVASLGSDAAMVEDSANADELLGLLRTHRDQIRGYRRACRIGEP